MKKSGVYGCLFVAFLVFSVLFGALSVSAEESTITFPYNDIAIGICDKQTTATATKNVTKDGKKTVKIVPTPDGAMASTHNIIVDAYDIRKKGFDLDVHTFVTIEYKYEAQNPKYNGKMGIRILKNKTGLDQNIEIESFSDIKAGDWNVATFVVGHRVKPYLNDSASHVVWQLHVHPFGTRTANKLSEDDVIYIGDITFTTVNPKPEGKYMVSFSAGDIEADEVVEPIFVSDGEEYVMPECPYTLDGYDFAGWKNVLSDVMGSGSVTPEELNMIRYPGDKVTMNGADVEYFPTWELKGTISGVKVLDFPSYFSGIIDGKSTYKDICLGTEKLEIDGLYALKALPNPNAESGVYFGFDGWNYDTASIDTRKYKYAAMVYKFDTKENHEDFHTQFRNINGGYKSGSGLVITSEEPLVMGKWDVVTFDLTKYTDYIDTSNPIIKQIHLMPFQPGKIRELSEGDAFYLAKLVFFEKKPEKLEIHSAFLTGFEDGTFRPGEYLTRAEACTMFTRILSSENAVKDKYISKFSDVNKGDWYYDNIAYLESIGFLRDYGSSFFPDEYIDRDEFSRLVYYLSLYNSGAFEIDGFNSALLSEEEEAEYTYIPSNNITRAEAVRLINICLDKRIYKNDVLEGYDGITFYRDVAESHWAYMDIVEASVSHGVYGVSKNGEEWFYMVDVADNSGETTPEMMVAEIDALAARRKNEILNTTDNITVSGTTYYVSGSGNDNNDGKSPETAWATLSKVSSASVLKSGDAVLFNRGDLFRGNLTTKNGVTYGAYGEGAKPVISASEENGADESKWSLVSGTSNIWIYNKQMVNLGGIVAVKNGEEILLERKVVCYSQSDDAYYLDTGKNTKFDPYKDLQNGWMFVAEKTSNVSTEKSDILVRCDEGNPGKVYSSIEFIDGKAHAINAKSNVTIDNLAIKYTSRHGIGAGTVSNLKVTNCEIGWIGGGLQNYTKNSSGVFSAVRYGNGVEVYGGCDNFVIDNCYVYQCFDAGITNQYQKGGSNAITEQNVYFTNNLIEYCCYSIEYFMGIADTDATRFLKNIYYENNILRHAGYGFGRTNPTNAAHIKGWDHYNKAENFIIRSNIFDRSWGDILHIGAQQVAWLPQLRDNTYIQYEDGVFGHIGANPTTKYLYTADVPHILSSMFGEESKEIYYVKK